MPALVDEACVAGVRLVRRELQPQLDSILDGASWKLNMRQTMTMADLQAKTFRTKQKRGLNRLRKNMRGLAAVGLR